MTENPFMVRPYLEGDSFILKGNETGILLVHGYTATTAEVRLLAECLHTAGFTVSAPLLPGHGTYPAEINKLKWMDWYESVEAAFLELRQSCQQVFIGGESMGAVLTLLIASRYTQIQGIMLFAPAIKIPKLWMAYILKFFMPWLKKQDKDDGLAWKGYNVYPVKGAIQMMKMQSVARRELKFITQPTIIFIGKHDKTIAPNSGELIIDRIKSTQKSIRLMQESPHCIILDHEVGNVCQQCQEFITRNSQ